MCLVGLVWKSHPRWRLLMAGNRDEFHARPTAALQAWVESGGQVLAGRDLRSGGTWMGASPDGRAAVVTNFRDPLARPEGPSRGALVATYLARSMGAADQAGALLARAPAYPPFNLLLADAESCHFLSNHPLQDRALEPGIHGLSNGALDAPWPKTRRLLTAMAEWREDGGDDLTRLWQALADETRAADPELPDTGVGLELERRLSPSFIRGPEYGTRASTLLGIDHHGHGFIHEKRFGAEGRFLGETRLEFGGEQD
jgi:Uncharacterized conserved protein